MKKVFLSLSFLALIIAVVTLKPVKAAPAPVDSSTCPVPETIGVCADPANPDYYNGACRPHITSCPGTQVFTCASGCQVATCASGSIDINPSSGLTCRTLVNVVADTLYKVWDGTALRRLVYVDDTNCTNGQVIQWDTDLNNDGTAGDSGWVCASASSQWATSGTNITYSAGNVGIGSAPAGGGTFPGLRLDVNGSAVIRGDFGVTGAVDIPARSIHGSRLSNYSVTRDQIANDTITWRQIADNAISSVQLADNTVNSNKLVDNSILSVDIWNGAVTNDDISNDTITGAKIAHETITGGVDNAANGDIAYGTVTSWNVLDRTLTAEDIATNSINTWHIINSTISSNDLADNVVNSAKIVNESILAEDIEDNAVGTSELAANSVKASKLDYYFTGTRKIINFLDDAVTFAVCDAGDFVLSGECWGEYDGAMSYQVSIRGSYRSYGLPTHPADDGTEDRWGWRCRGHNHAGGGRDIVARALCIRH